MNILFVCVNKSFVRDFTVDELKKRKSPTVKLQTTTGSKTLSKDACLKCCSVLLLFPSSASSWSRMW